MGDINGGWEGLRWECLGFMEFGLQWVRFFSCGNLCWSFGLLSSNMDRTHSLVIATYMNITIFDKESRRIDQVNQKIQGFMQDIKGPIELTDKYFLTPNHEIEFGLLWLMDKLLVSVWKGRCCWIAVCGRGYRRGVRDYVGWFTCRKTLGCFYGLKWFGY